MNIPKKRILIVVLSLVIVAALMTLGSLLGYAPETSTKNSSPSSTASSGAYGGSAETRDLLAPDAAVSSAPQDEVGKAAVASDEDMVIRTGQLTLRVKDAQKSVEKVRAAVRAADAEITDLNITQGSVDPIVYEGVSSSTGDGPVTAYITVRVAAEDLDELTDAIAGVGTVTSRSESSADVTEQAVDLEARLKNLRAEESRLRELLDRTNAVEDLLAVERELARVRGEIEAMDAQLTYLKRQVAKATLTITLAEPAALVSPADSTWGLREAITEGIRDAVALMTGAIALLIAISPIIVLGAIVWAGARFVSRRRARKAGSDSEMPG